MLEIVYRLKCKANITVFGHAGKRSRKIINYNAGKAAYQRPGKLYTREILHKDPRKRETACIRANGNMNEHDVALIPPRCTDIHM